jgi:hypothetical protein
MVWTTPYRLVLKLSWDDEKQVSSNFALRKRKKSAKVIPGKWRGLQIIFFPSLPFEVPE